MAESSPRSPQPVTYTLRCEHCQNSSTHPLIVYNGVSVARMAQHLQNYAEHHAQCKPE